MTETKVEPKAESGGLMIDGVEWIPVRDAANLINSTPATIYNQVNKAGGDGQPVIAKLLVGTSVLLVSREDTLDYGKGKKTYFERFKEGSNN